MQPTCSPAPLASSIVNICTPPSAPLVNTCIEGAPGNPLLTFKVSSNRHRRTNNNWHPYNNLVVHNGDGTVVDIDEHEGDIFDMLE